MAAGFRPSRCGICCKIANRRLYSKKVNQLNRLTIERGTSLVRLTLSLFFLLEALTVGAQTPDASRLIFIHGLIATARGQPVARATVELRDLRGMKMAAGFTDSAGKFTLTTTAIPGEYVLLAVKELQIGDERITLDQSDREVTIAFPVAPSTVAALSQPTYTVSAQELRVPAKARAHLKSAHLEFSKLNFGGAEREIDQALRVDSMCAAAFSMRALLRLASGDPKGAIEDATRALALDSGEADAYVALATAYNSLGEFQRAETAAQEALTRRPDFWQARLEMVKASYGEGRFVLALCELDELNNDFPDVHLVRANILQRLDRGQEAAEQFSQFLREARNDPRSEEVKRIVASSTAVAIPRLSFHP
jgi:tetratricopeptide (TPR) repeat protein